MAADCIFCKIVAGEIPSRTVYEDDDVLAFLDVNPLARGHTLVVPKDHVELLEDMATEDARPLMTALHRLVRPVQRAVEAHGSTVAFNNGRVAGQEVPHVHAHIVPRFDRDRAGPIHALFSGEELADEEMDAVAEAIRERLP